LIVRLVTFPTDKTCFCAEAARALISRVNTQMVFMVVGIIK
jgi:hypothetical protein